MMPKKNPSKRALVKFPLNVDIENTKTQERRILEFVPNTVKASEAVIVKAEKWGGLSKQCFAVLNVDREELIIKQLKEEKNNPITAGKSTTDESDEKKDGLQSEP